MKRFALILTLLVLHPTDYTTTTIKLRQPAMLVISAFLAVNAFAAEGPYETRKKADPLVVYQGKNLGGVDFQVGAVGGSVIRMNGKAERAWWQIFHNHEQRKGSDVVPNSFLAIRTKVGDSTQVRALQTTAVGPFAAMRDLRFSGEYPFGWLNVAEI